MYMPQEAMDLQAEYEAQMKTEYEAMMKAEYENMLRQEGLREAYRREMLMDMYGEDAIFIR